MAPRPQVTRRDLWGRWSRQAEPSVATPVGNAPAATDLLRARRPLMGTFFDIRLPVSAPGALDLATRGLDLIEALEDQLTVYRDSSEVSRLNATAHEGPVEVEPGLFALLELARELWEATSGAYDVTTGALSEAWGFFRGPRRVPEAASLADARERTGQHHLTVDPQQRTVSSDRAGVQINLGSIGKGHALDRAGALVSAHWWPTPALLHGGQSSVLALGSPPGEFGGRWQVALRNPIDPSRPLGTFRLRNRAMGTSGASFQQFEAGGRLYGHILDPRSGEPPSQGPLSVTVLAPSAAEADALSTAFYLLGPEAAARLVSRRPEVGVLFILDPVGGDDRPRAIPINLQPHDFEADRRLKCLASPQPRTD